jgi:hypothetical protein
LDLEERILILVPTLFFLITVAWGYLFQQLILNEIREADPSHFQRIKTLLRPHFHQVTYSDAIFLFMVNGIVWILQLYKMGLGVIIMVTGVVVAITGLLSSFMWRYEHGEAISKWTMLVMIILATIEFALFVYIP